MTLTYTLIISLILLMVIALYHRSKLEPWLGQNKETIGLITIISTGLGIYALIDQMVASRTTAVLHVVTAELDKSNNDINVLKLVTEHYRQLPGRAIRPSLAPSSGNTPASRKLTAEDSRIAAASVVKKNTADYRSAYQADFASFEMNSSAVASMEAAIAILMESEKILEPEDASSKRAREEKNKRKQHNAAKIIAPQIKAGADDFDPTVRAAALRIGSYLLQPDPAMLTPTADQHEIQVLREAFRNKFLGMISYGGSGRKWTAFDFTGTDFFLADFASPTFDDSIVSKTSFQGVTFSGRSSWKNINRRGSRPLFTPDLSSDPNDNLPRKRQPEKITDSSADNLAPLNAENYFASAFTNVVFEGPCEFIDSHLPDTVFGPSDSIIDKDGVTRAYQTQWKQGGVFSNTNLSGTKFTQCVFEGTTKFDKKTDLTGAKFDQASLSGVTFTDVVWTPIPQSAHEPAPASDAPMPAQALTIADKTSASQRTLGPPSFAGTKFVANVVVNKTSLQGATFEEAIFDSVIFSGESATSRLPMKAAIFKKLKKENTSRQVTFRFVDLTGADFTTADLTGIHFESCLLDNVNFETAILTDATFKDCTGNNVIFPDLKLPKSIEGGRFAQGSWLVPFTQPSVFKGVEISNVFLSKALIDACNNDDERESFVNQKGDRARLIMAPEEKTLCIAGTPAEKPAGTPGIYTLAGYVTSRAAKADHALLNSFNSDITALLNARHKDFGLDKPNKEGLTGSSVWVASLAAHPKVISWTPKP